MTIPGRLPFLLCVLSGIAFSQWPETPVRALTDPGVITTRQELSPAGVQAIVKGRVYGVAFGENSEEILLATNLAYFRFNWKSNKTLAHQDWNGTPGMQSLSYDRVGRQALTVVGALSKSGQTPGTCAVRLPQWFHGETALRFQRLHFGFAWPREPGAPCCGPTHLREQSSGNRPPT
jgi:hypothetical protein